MKVLLVSPYSAKRTGGIGTWTKIVMDYGQSFPGVELCFLNTATELPKRWAMGHTITRWLVGIVDSLRIICKLFWRMLKEQPDVVHYTSSASSALYKDLLAIWIVKGLFRQKFVIHWHFGRIASICEERGKEYRLFCKVCKKVDESIPIDERSFVALQNEGFKSMFVPNPIPIELQQKAESIDVNALAEKRVKGEVLFVGHMLRGKGILELVHACAENEAVKKLTMVGPFFDENLREELTSIAARRDNGLWLSLVGEKKREEVWEYYQKCGVFCLPSYSEGFPYVILEAMAFGCPIVATRVGAIPEMLADGSGELVDARDIKQLGNSLHRVLTNHDFSCAIGEKAHERVLYEYTIERVFMMYYEIWESGIRA